MTAKRKSDSRWEQYNYLVDEICPRFKAPSYGMILLACFRHARDYGSRMGYFRVSLRRIAKSAGMSERHVRRIMRELEEWGVIEMKKEAVGTLPRIFRIRFERDDGQLTVPCTIAAKGVSHAKSA